MLNPYENAAPLAVRQKIRAGEITGQTSGMCLGYAQANLAVLPKDLAYDFLLFTQRNPKPCPILEVSDVGDPWLHRIAKDCNIATDIPKYRVYEKGVMVALHMAESPIIPNNNIRFIKIKINGFYSYISCNNRKTA